MPSVRAARPKQKASIPRGDDSEHGCSIARSEDNWRAAFDQRPAHAGRSVAQRRQSLFRRTWAEPNGNQYCSEEEPQPLICVEAQNTCPPHEHPEKEERNRSWENETMEHKNRCYFIAPER